VIENVEITGYAAEGKSLGHVNGKVIFVTGAVPGDTANVLVTKNKKDWAEGRATNITAESKDRIDPFCIHFGTCGGCKWQMLSYDKQLLYKQQEAEQNFKRIGKVPLPPVMPIVGSADTIYYRNKLEFTFSNKRYLTNTEIDRSKEIPQENALGYHAPGIFDKIIDIHECFLMDDINNSIRNSIRAYAISNSLSYYDIKNHTGLLRNLVVRYCTTGELMVNLVFGYEDIDVIKRLADDLLKKIPSISTLLYTINTKWNDNTSDLPSIVYSGKGYVTERMGEFQFKISPSSFFQTNTRQAEKLYRITHDFAGLSGNEILYDLYCGTGTIGLFLSASVKKIIGVDVTMKAIEDARENAVLNGVEHASFFQGDVVDVCTPSFFETHGIPDVIVTAPPRAGMHEKLISKLLSIGAAKIVYISCNTATQARDINLLSEKYQVERIQPVDMFPHTHHIECVVLLKLKD